ncbi:hypothetical protein AB1Y20_012023 [Prymnesium parvum]|uniref:PDEase domain-containing protein n=1 Tax=Prymnesium parvum TaxID=97485 RepID=A0AB34IQ52_PRYPA
MDGAFPAQLPRFDRRAIPPFPCGTSPPLRRLTAGSGDAMERETNAEKKAHRRKKLTCRGKLRVLLDSSKVELFTVSLVLVYLLFIVIDIALPDVAFPCDAELKDTWQRAFWCIDMGFLCLFMLELGIRLFAWGPIYLRDPFNAIDAAIIIGSFTVAIIVFPSVFAQNANGDSVRSTSQITRLVRIVRVFRLLTAMTKFQKNRASTDVRRKKAKYRKTGSYVERVIDILQKLRKSSPFMEHNEDRENLNFIIDIIVSDQLYAVHLQGGEGGVSADVQGFLQQTGVETATRRNKGQTGSFSKSDFANSGATQEELAAEGADGRKMRQSASRLANNELLWVDKLLDEDEVSAHLADAFKWDFNMFELETKSQKHPVLTMVLHLVHTLDLEDQLPINMSSLMKYLTVLEASYNDPPFHNYLHAADCTHGTTYFLLQPKVRQHFSPLDIYSLILAAAMHDCAHPGYSNAFLVNSKHEFAILYNDSSVLESYHVSRAWRLMLEKGQDPFEGFAKEQYTEARQTIVACILGTDMKFHFDHLTKFKTRVGAGAFDSPDRKDVRLLLTMCLHAADVSNPAKPWDLSKEWTSRVMDEFFRQGDAESEAGLPISPFMDRSKTNIATCQVGFINILIKPFFLEWCQFLGEECMRDVFANVESNVAKWEAEGEAVLGDRLEKIKTPPPVAARASSAGMKT